MTTKWVLTRHRTDLPPQHRYHGRQVWARIDGTIWAHDEPDINKATRWSSEEGATDAATAIKDGWQATRLGGNHG